MKSGMIEHQGNIIDCRCRSVGFPANLPIIKIPGYVTEDIRRQENIVWQEFRSGLNQEAFSTTGPVFFRIGNIKFESLAIGKADIVEPDLVITILGGFNRDGNIVAPDLFF
jgi:hypothetical protein